MDLTCVSSSVFSVIHIVLRAATYKVTKHEKTSIDNQHIFISFTFLAAEDVELVNRGMRVMHNFFMTEDL